MQSRLQILQMGTLALTLLIMLTSWSCNLDASCTSQIFPSTTHRCQLSSYLGSVATHGFTEVFTVVDINPKASWRWEVARWGVWQRGTIRWPWNSWDQHIDIEIDMKWLLWIETCCFCCWMTEGHKNKQIIKFIERTMWVKQPCFWYLDSSATPPRRIKSDMCGIPTPHFGKCQMQKLWDIKRLA